METLWKNIGLFFIEDIPNKVPELHGCQKWWARLYLLITQRIFNLWIRKDCIALMLSNCCVRQKCTHAELWDSRSCSTFVSFVCLIVKKHTFQIFKSIEELKYELKKWSNPFVLTAAGYMAKVPIFPNHQRRHLLLPETLCESSPRFFPPRLDGAAPSQVGGKALTSWLFFTASRQLAFKVVAAQHLFPLTRFSESPCGQPFRGRRSPFVMSQGALSLLPGQW